MQQKEINKKSIAWGRSLRHIHLGPFPCPAFFLFLPLVRSAECPARVLLPQSPSLPVSNAPQAANGSTWLAVNCEPRLLTRLNSSGQVEPNLEAPMRHDVELDPTAITRITIFISFTSFTRFILHLALLPHSIIINPAIQQSDSPTVRQSDSPTPFTFLS